MIVITGGAGFIGSYLAMRLEAAGLGPLVICDRLGSGAKWRNVGKRALYDFLPPEQLFDFLDAHKARVEMIFHLGAISSTTETDADKIIENNFRLSKDLFTWCANYKRRLVYASSAATYGDGKLGFEDKEDLAFLKTLRPLNPYGWSKHMFDLYVALARENGEKFPAQCVGLKFFNVYGPNEYHKEGQRSVAHQIYPVAAKGEPFALFASAHPDYEDGGQLRDFVWVGDCAAVMEWLYHHPRVNGLFNVGSGKARSFKDLAVALYNAAGMPPQITYKPMPEALAAQYQYYTQATDAKLRQAGFATPMTALEDGIKQYVSYLSQPDCYA